MRRMVVHSGRFVDDNYRVVLKNNIEIDVFGPHRRSPRFIDGDLDEIVRPEAIADVFVAAVDLALSGFHKIAKVHLAQAAEMIEQKIFEPHLVMRGGGLYFDAVYHAWILPHADARA